MCCFGGKLGDNKEVCISVYLAAVSVVIKLGDFHLLALISCLIEY